MTDNPARTRGPEARALTTLPATREGLLELHRAARARRNAAPLGSEAYRQASEQVGEIEVAISGLVPAGPLPSA
jgi:hypothetical protein